MVALIDYDAGNVKSVEKAVEHLGYTARLTRDREDLLNADSVILPGVGSFGDACARLDEYGISPVIREVTEAGIPFLGICLGLQLLFESSEESPGVDGLGLVGGHIRRIPDVGLKVPHIGWNSLSFPHSGRMFRGIDEGAYVYFVHSYYLEAADESVVTATTEYATHIHAAIEKDNIFAVQFHPEKSSDVGLKMLSNFLEIR
ncbi:MAG: imidazole glycerol phosphate synthase subunit HisH [Lachnospiraceae bacterium]|nr:imidazole glycerol phosphate synthase subunit HisH [Lachnospiraceae bacterium]